MYEGYDAERIGIQPEWLIEFIKMHQIDSTDAKFKIGDSVIHFTKIVTLETEHTVLAVNVQEPGVIEYALSNMFYLVWEEEMRNAT